MMKYMMRFEKNIPVMVSVRANHNSPAVALLRWESESSKRKRTARMVRELRKLGYRVETASVQPVQLGNPA
jgi:hypothetical protein